MSSDTVNPPMMLRSTIAGGFCRMNDSFEKLIGYSADETSQKNFEEWIHPNDREKYQSLCSGKISECTIQYVTRSEESIPVTVKVTEHEGETVLLIRKETLLESTVGPEDSDDVATVTGTLHTIARIVEEQNPGYKCSILLVADGRFVRGAGPSLPEEYNSAIDGFAIGPTIGSCGTAIYWGVPIIVNDIQADPLWAPFAELASKAGVASCWSHPFSSLGGNVLGALALYSPIPQTPTDEQLSRLKAAAEMTGLAVERGRAEEALRKEQERLAQLLDKTAILKNKAEEANVLKDQFITNMSHELRTPLGTIIGMTDLALQTTLTENQNSLLEVIKESSSILHAHVEDILDFSKIETGAFELERKNFQLRDVLDHIEDSFLQKALRKNIEMVIATPLDPSLSLYGDPNRIVQVLGHLIDNALKFTAPGGGIVIYAEKGESSQLQQQIRFSVSDSGIGICESNYNSIFDTFTQLDSSQTRAYEGTGLGLSICKRLSEHMGGTINVKSVENCGSQFQFFIPLILASNMTDQDTGKRVKDNISNDMLQILVADSDETELSFYQNTIEKMDHRLIFAHTGMEAIHQFQSNEFDLIFLSTEMLDMNGIDTAAIIRNLEQQEDKQEVPIVALTKHPLNEEKENCMKAGITDYMAKPSESSELSEKINSLSRR